MMKIEDRAEAHRVEAATTLSVVQVALHSVEKALAWLKKATGDTPRKKLARRTDTGWVFFPPDRCGNWHSISIVVEG
jgi:hypothetical protein